MKLTRHRRFDGIDLPAYKHPNGWRIYKIKRDWSARGFPNGISMADKNPLYSYVVYIADRPNKQQPYGVESFTTLRETRAYCDAHKPQRVADPTSKLGWRWEILAEEIAA